MLHPVVDTYLLGVQSLAVDEVGSDVLDAFATTMYEQALKEIAAGRVSDPAALAKQCLDAHARVSEESHAQICAYYAEMGKKQRKKA